MNLTTNVPVEELVQLTEHLTALVMREVAILKDRRPSALKTNDDERAQSLALYAKRCAAFKRDIATTPLSNDAKEKLTAASEKLRAALKEEGRLLAGFRHVTEGLVKAIADEVAARHTPIAYAKAGAFAKLNATAASAMTYNQTI